MIGEGEQLTQLKTWVSLPGPLSGAFFFFAKKMQQCSTHQSPQSVKLDFHVYLQIFTEHSPQSWLHLSDSNMDDSRCLMNHLVVISEEAASKAVEIGLLGTWHLRDFRLAGSFDSLLKCSKEPGSRWQHFRTQAIL